MLLAVDFYEDFIDEESITITAVLSLQTAGMNGTEFDALEADRLAADGDASLGH